MGLGMLLEEKYVWLGLVDFVMLPSKTLRTVSIGMTERRS